MESNIEVVGANELPDAKGTNPWEKAGQKKAIEKKMNSAVKHHELFNAVYAILRPILKNVSDELQSTNISTLALFEILRDKLGVSADDVAAKEAEIIERIKAMSEAGEDVNADVAAPAPVEVEHEQSGIVIVER
jgi:hypothetical protein